MWKRKKEATSLVIGSQTHNRTTPGHLRVCLLFHIISSVYVVSFCAHVLVFEDRDALLVEW